MSDPPSGSGERPAGKRAPAATVDALIGLGSNVAPERHLPEAVRLLRSACPTLRASSVWATVPVGPPGQPPFLNAAVVLETSLSPRRLKHELLRRVEHLLGRVRGRDRYAPRPIDLDLLLYGDRCLRLDGRELPDASLLRYAHVAVPAAELTPDWRHPVTREPLARIADRLLRALPVAERPQRRAKPSLAAPGGG